MIRCAEVLAAGLDFIRVDLYDTDDKVYFGEFTITPEAGNPPTRRMSSTITSVGCGAVAPALCREPPRYDTQKRIPRGVHQEARAAGDGSGSGRAVVLADGSSGSQLPPRASGGAARATGPPGA